MIVSTSAFDVALGRPRAPRSSAAPFTSSTMRRASALVERRHAERDVLEHLDEHAAETEQDRRAEQVVVRHADDALGAAGDHLARRARRRRCAAIAFIRGARTSLADRSPTFTRPRSDLWAMAAELAFTTTG